MYQSTTGSELLAIDRPESALVAMPGGPVEGQDSLVLVRSERQRILRDLYTAQTHLMGTDMTDESLRQR